MKVLPGLIMPKNALLADKEFCNNQYSYLNYDNRIFGTTACEGPDSAGVGVSNYHAYGFPCRADISNVANGTVAVYGSGSAMPFIYNDASACLNYYYNELDVLFNNEYGYHFWSPVFGFPDAFHLDPDNCNDTSVNNLGFRGPWLSVPRFGIDIGPMLINIDSYLSELAGDTSIRDLFSQYPPIAENLSEFDPIINFFDLNVLLEGPFNGTDMNTGINTENFLPLSQPYNSTPWNYTGTESIGTIPNDSIVDWILLELRETTGDASSATSDSVIAQKAVFLLKNGSAVDISGNSMPMFNLKIRDSLYVVVWHRNHLGIMSAYPLTESSGIYSHDFTTNENQAYSDTLSVKELIQGIWGMFAGDGNADGEINDADKINVWEMVAGEAGYFSGDFNMDTEVDNKDKDDIWVPNGGNGSQVPE